MMAGNFLQWELATQLPFLSRALPQLSRQGHTEDCSPGRGRKEGRGQVRAAKAQCFLFQGEQHPAALWLGLTDFCSLTSSQTHLLLCPAYLLLLSSVHSLLYSHLIPLPGLFLAPFACNAPLCPDSHPRCKTHSRHLCLSTHQMVWRSPHLYLHSSSFASLRSTRQWLRERVV